MIDEKIDELHIKLKNLIEKNKKYASLANKLEEEELKLDYHHINYDNAKNELENRIKKYDEMMKETREEITKTKLEIKKLIDHKKYLNEIVKNKEQEIIKDVVNENYQETQDDKYFYLRSIIFFISIVLIIIFFIYKQS